jgi:hypothetical protein
MSLRRTTKIYHKIFLIEQENLPIAYGIAAIGVFQITTYCVLGTIVEDSVYCFSKCLY